MMAGMDSISWTTLIFLPTLASAFSTAMRMACGRLGMMSGWLASSARVMAVSRDAARFTPPDTKRVTFLAEDTEGEVLRVGRPDSIGPIRKRRSMSSGCTSTRVEGCALYTSAQSTRPTLSHSNI